MCMASTSGAGMTVAVLVRLSTRRRPVPIHPFRSEFRLHVPSLVIHLIGQINLYFLTLLLLTSFIRASSLRFSLAARLSCLT